MGVIVPSFNYTNWANLFPEFSGTVSSYQATTMFDVVTSTLVRNDGGGPVSNITTATTLLNFAVAHLCFLYYGTNTQPAAQVVGRINSASEGSVSVQTDYGTNVSGSESFWVQSKYGATYWQMIRPYRTARYLGGQPNSAIPFRPIGPYFWRP